MQNKKNSQKGFTLIELVVVIGILVVLLTIVLVAINPSRQFKQANDTKRRSDVSAILNAVSQYAAEHTGSLPGDINTTVKTIGSGSSNADICTDVVSKYISALPVDPTSVVNGVDQIVCDVGTSTYNTGYQIKADANNRVTVSAPGSELADPDISITR